MSQITYVNSSAANGDATGASSVVITLAAHVADDLLLACVFHQVAATTDIACTTPGWAEIVPSGGALAGIKWFWKRAASSAETNPTFTSAASDMWAVVHNFRGALKTGTPFQVGASANTASAAGVPSATITPNRDFTTQIVMYGRLANTATTGTAATWTRYGQQQSALGVGAAFGVHGLRSQRQVAVVSTTSLATYAAAARSSSLILSLYAEVDPLTTAVTADGASTSDTTPALEFTGDSANARDLRYKFLLFANNSETVCDSLTTGVSTVGSLADNITTTTSVAIGQSFTGNGGYLHRVTFHLYRVGTPSYNLRAYLYAHSGTFGTDSVPTGPPLAISDPVVASTLGTTQSDISFYFGGSFQLVNTTKYCMVLVAETTGNTTNYVGVMGTNTHGGNLVRTSFQSPANTEWGSLNTLDCRFSVYTISAPTQTKISGTDAGFLNTVTGGDTDPFNDNEKIEYTVQSALALGTYYWSAGAAEPSGDNTYVHFSPLRSIQITAGGGGTAFTQNLSGGLTPGGSVRLVKAINQRKVGGLTPGGTLLKNIANFKVGTVTGAGAVIKLAAKPVAGGLTPTGSMLAVKGKGVAGNISPTGTLGRVITQIKTGAFTPSGLLSKLVAVRKAGGLTPSGALAALKLLNKAVAGSLTPTGLLVKLTGQQKAGAVVPAGTVRKQVTQAKAGGITPSGASASGKFFSRAVSGSIASAGLLVKLVTQRKTGAVTPAGTVQRLVAKALAGSAASAGALRKAPAKALAGLAATAGALRRTASLLKQGTVVGQGNLTGAGTPTLSVSGNIAPTGGLARRLTLFKTYSGGLTPSGAVTRIVAKVKLLTGNLGSSGLIRYAISRTFTGSVSFAGTLVKNVAKYLSGFLTPAGSLTPFLDIGGYEAGQLEVKVFNATELYTEMLPNLEVTVKLATDEYTEML